MSLISDKAIVLRRLDYSETSQILALFTREHGQVRVIAKGIKRSTRLRFAVGIDLLELGHVVWSARADRPQNLGILTEWKQVNAFVGLRERLERLHAAQYAAEITAELTTDQDPHPTLFDHLKLFLGKLSAGPRACPGLNSQEQSASHSAIRNPNSAIPKSSRALADLCEFQRSLLTEIGLMPQGGDCVGCRSAITPERAEGVYFTSHEGGLLCRDCEANYVEKRRVSPGAVRILAGGPIEDPLAGELFALLNYHISHLMHKEPRLAKFILPVI